MTLGQCLDKVYKLINYFSLSGNKIARIDATATDYRYRAVSLIDTAQKELCVHYPIRKTCTMTQKRLRNLLPDATLADVGKRTVFDVSGAASMTFLTDAPLKVTVQYWQDAAEETEGSPAVEAGWVEQASLTTAKYACFKEYVLRFEPFDRQQILFASLDPASYTYVGNMAVYAEQFASDMDVPPWRSFRSHTLPEDFYRFEEVTFQPTPSSFVTKDVPYALGYRTIDIDRRFDGSFLVVYRAMCPTIDEQSSEDTPLVIDEVCAELIPYYAAAILSAEENPQLSQQLMSLYRTKLANLDVSAVTDHIRNDFYGGGVRGAI